MVIVVELKNALSRPNMKLTLKVSLCVKPVKEKMNMPVSCNARNAPCISLM